jgi:hypothetical protein
LAHLIKERGETVDTVRKEIESKVRYANITIIEGDDASQFGIGIVAARITEMVVRDERAVIPIGSYNDTFWPHAVTSQYCRTKWSAPKLRTGDVTQGAACAGAWCCQFTEIVRPKLRSSGVGPTIIQRAMSSTSE